jgi:hypothetical protein
MRLLPLLSVAVTVATACLLPAGCGDGAAPTSSSKPTPAPAARTPAAMATVPVPKGDVVLRLSRVGAANRRRGVAAFDLATIDRLADTDVTVREPFLKRDMRFSGVRLKSLLGAARAPAAAKRVQMHALDDYTVDLTVDDLIASDALLATRADGKTIPVAKGGPIRIVFLGDTKTARNSDMWIWSVDSMKIVG